MGCLAFTPAGTAVGPPLVAVSPQRSRQRYKKYEEEQDEDTCVRHVRREQVENYSTTSYSTPRSASSYLVLPDCGVVVA